MLQCSLCVGSPCLGGICLETADGGLVAVQRRVMSPSALGPAVSDYDRYCLTIDYKNPATFRTLLVERRPL